MRRSTAGLVAVLIATSFATVACTTSSSSSPPASSPATGATVASSAPPTTGPPPATSPPTSATAAEATAPPTTAAPAPVFEWVVVPDGWDVTATGDELFDPDGTVRVNLDPPIGWAGGTLGVGATWTGTVGGYPATGVEFDVTADERPVRRLVLSVDAPGRPVTIWVDTPPDSATFDGGGLATALGLDLEPAAFDDPRALAAATVREYLELLASSDPADAAEAAARSIDYAHWYASLFADLAPDEPGTVTEIGDGAWEVCDGNGCVVLSDWVGRGGVPAAFSIDGIPLRSRLWRPADLVGGGCVGRAADLCVDATPGVAELSSAFVSGGGLLVVVWELDTTLGSLVLPTVDGVPDVSIVDGPADVGRQSCGLDTATFGFSAVTAGIRFDDGQRDTFWCLFNGFDPLPAFDQLVITMPAIVDGTATTYAWVLPELAE